MARTSTISDVDLANLLRSRDVPDPAVDTFNQRFYFGQPPQYIPGTPVQPGYRERFLDSTKVISQLQPGGYRPLPPGLMRLAGDVVPMQPGAQGLSDAINRLIQAGPGAQGMQSIQGRQYGPKSLDLLNILRFPGGGQMAPPMRGSRAYPAPPTDQGDEIG